MAAIDHEGVVLYANNTAERVSGITTKKLLGRLIFDLILEEERPRCVGRFKSWSTSGSDEALVFESHLAHSDGSTRFVLWRLTRQNPGGQGSVLLCCVKDITALREAKQLGSEREIRLASLVAGMLDAVITIDTHGTIQFASASVRTYFGYEPEELVGQNVKIIMPEPHRSRHDEYLARYRATGETEILNTTREFQAVRKSGARFWIEISVSRIDVPGQDEPMICGTIRNTTTRKKAEDALKDREERLRAIFDQEFQLVGLLDPTGRILEMNRSALRSANASHSSLLGRPFWETPFWAHDAGLQTRLRTWIRRAARGEFIREETVHTDASGDSRIVDFSLKPILNEEGEVILLLPEGRDITEFKRAQTRETQILRALAAIGESASILAHEIKNPITSINLALRSVVDKIGEDEKAVLEDLVGRLQRLEHTIRRTLSFAKPLDLQPSMTDVLPLVLEPVDTLRAQADSLSAEIDLDVATDCPPLHVDTTLLNEVLSNLIGNALEALENGGNVLVRAYPSGSAWVEIVVEDDGPGIPEKLWSTIFRPFITTKEKGTGLGLPLVRKIVEEHGGIVTVDRSSRLGGACFTLRLPTKRA